MNSAAVAPSSRVDQLCVRLREARGRSGELFDIVRPEALYDRPIPERHRIIFYLGHLEAFDWNLLRGPLGLSSFDPGYRQTLRLRHRSRGWRPAGRSTRRLALGGPGSKLRQAPPRTIGRGDSRSRRGRPESCAPQTWPPAGSGHRASPDACRDPVLHAAPVAPGPQISASHWPRHSPRLPRARAAWKYPQGPPRWGWHEAKMELLAGTMNSKSTGSKFRRLESTRITSRTGTICASCATAATSAARFGAIPGGSGSPHRNTPIPRFGFPTGIPGAIERCLRKSRCHSTGQCTSATMRRRPTRAGRARNCRAKRNGIAPLAAAVMARSEPTPGERMRQRPGMAILISSAGIRLPWGRIPKETANLGLPIWRVTAGNGRARRLRHFPVFSLLRSIQAIPRIFLTASIL